MVPTQWVSRCSKLHHYLLSNVNSDSKEFTYALRIIFATSILHNYPKTTNTKILWNDRIGKPITKIMISIKQTGGPKSDP